jgi:peptide-methionine (S)-S-oxide reductase
MQVIMKNKLVYLIIILFIIIYNDSYSQKNKENEMVKMNENNNAKLEIATFGTGCFWCTEAVFERLDGVVKVISGYSGGHVKNPSYKEVCTGTTGHAEVTQIYFDPRIISYEELLDVFWYIHDPTTLNRQGNDIGTQYRSVIFYHDDNQKRIAEESKHKTEISGIYKDLIVTEISPLINFYEAEDYHQDYFKNNPNQPYCSVVISPKLKKFTAKYQDKLK